MPPISQPTPSAADVAAAQAGDRPALERVVRAIQDRIYHLALRTLVDPQEALDATQEILIIVITKLSTTPATAPSPPGPTASPSTRCTTPGGVRRP